MAEYEAKDLSKMTIRIQITSWHVREFLRGLSNPRKRFPGEQVKNTVGAGYCLERDG